MLLSMSTMIVSISTPLMATGCRTYKFELDLSEVKKDQMFGYTTTYDIHPTHDVSKIKFSCTDPKVLEASWEDNKLVITPKNTGSTTLIITATDNDGNEIVKDIDIEVDSKIHEFINERTFSLKYLYFNDDSQKYLNETGTGWLFYHETDINKTHNDYTYYLLTNNHVASSFQHGLEIAKLHPEKKQFLGFAYQNWDEARTTTEIFNPNGNDENGSTCVYNKLTDNWTNTKEDKFCTLFTTYVSFVRNGVSRDFYRDLTICKIDLSDYANTPVGKNRLDKLNEYANKHNNKLIEFDDYSDLTTYNDLRTIYTGGFPFMCIDSSAGSIYPNYFIKFQSHIFNDCFPMSY